MRRVGAAEVDTLSENHLRIKACASCACCGVATCMHKHYVTVAAQNLLSANGNGDKHSSLTLTHRNAQSWMSG